MKRYFFVLLLFPAIVKSQNVGVNTSLPLERLHVNGSLFITPYNTTNDTIKNSSIGLGFNSNSIFAYNAAKAALRFGLPNPDTKWFNNNVGYYSLAFGVGADASGDASLAYGFNTKASGVNSTALGGYGNLADGYGAVAGGYNSIASGQTSFAFGQTLITRNNNSAVFGIYNDTTQNAGTLFSIGNGTANNNRKNALSVLENGYTGIGQSNPGYTLDVFDAANQGFFANFTSNNASNSFLQIQANAAGTNVANIGLGLYRNGNAKGYFYINGSNNFIWTTNGSEQVALTPAGNLGIGQNNPGFPLNFASSLGDKIALYGNSGNTYGVGVAANTLQIHTDIVASDVAFGYGSSAAFNETMRIKGNGNLNVKGDIITDINATNNGFASPGLRFGASNSGEAISSKRTAGANQNGLDFYTNGAARFSIDNSGLVGINGNTTPGARLQVNQTGNYNTSEGSTHAFEIWDNNETLYMGADGGNSISYIQAVGNSTFHTLALQARGGNVAIGKSTASEKIDVNGNGAFSGNVSVQSGKGIVRNYTGTQLKTEMIAFTFPGLVALGAGNTTNLSVTFPEAYTGTPMVYVAGLIPSAGSAGYSECVYNVSGITTTGFTLSIYNPRTSGATFNNGSPNFAINFVATGAQ